MPKTDLTLDVWQACSTFKIIAINKKETTIKKHELMFLIDRDGDFLIFKTEGNDVCKVHISILKQNKIKKIF